MFQRYSILLLLPLWLFASCTSETEASDDTSPDALQTTSLTDTKAASDSNAPTTSQDEASNTDEVRQPDDMLRDMEKLTGSTQNKNTEITSEGNGNTPNTASKEEEKTRSTSANPSNTTESSSSKSGSTSSSSGGNKSGSSSNSNPAPKETQPSKPSAPKSVSHDSWTKLLQKHVSSSGKVDYRGFQRDKQQLAAYLEHLAQHPPQNWSRNKEMAYWINLYNAATVQLIVQHYPVESITKLDNGKPWDVRRVRSGPRMYTLNQIEKDKLLKKFGEPRVHFAVNCAAASCPPLLNKAWTASNIERYYEQQTKSFINNERYNHIAPRKLELSKIFDWYKSDFNGVVGFIQRYAKEEVKDNARISYLEYDWSLND